MSPEGWIVIGTIGGAAVGALIAGGFNIITGGFNIWKHYIDKDSELRKQRNEAIISAGVQTWDTTMREYANKAILPPVELYIVQMINLVDIMLEPNFDKEKFKQALEDNRRLQEECLTILNSHEPFSPKRQGSKQTKNEEDDEINPLLKGPPFDR